MLDAKIESVVAATDEQRESFAGRTLSALLWINIGLAVLQAFLVLISQLKRNSLFGFKPYKYSILLQFYSFGMDIFDLVCSGLIIFIAFMNMTLLQEQHAHLELLPKLDQNLIQDHASNGIKKFQNDKTLCHREMYQQVNLCFRFVVRGDQTRYPSFRRRFHGRCLQNGELQAATHITALLCLF